MFQTQARKLADTLVKNGHGKDEDKDIIVYGLTSAIDIVFNLVTTVIVGVVLDMVLETFTFLLSFSPLRTYAGGYHASTPQKCYVLSVSIFILALLTLKYTTLTPIVYLGMLIVSTIVILVLSPQQDINKPLDKVEVKVYRKRSFMLLSINITAFIVISIFSWQNVANTIAISLCVVGVSVVIGKIKNMYISSYVR